MTETATTQYVDPNDVLMGGGDGIPGAKFDEPGASVEGIVTGFQSRQVREYNSVTKRSDGPGLKFPSGDPIMGILLDLQTQERDPFMEGDTGARRVYVEGKNLKQTIREAIQAAGGKGLEKGARLVLTFTHRDDPMDKRSAKHYTATYTTAANVQMMGGAPAADPAPAAVAPVPQSVPAPAPAPAAPAGDPVALCRQLIAAQVPDAAISAATGLDVVVIQAIRNQG